MRTRKIDLKWWAHFGLVQLLIFSLTYSPLPLSAADAAPKTDAWATNALGALNTFGNVFTTYMQQQMSATQQAQMMQSLQIEVVQDPYFPYCKLPKTRSSQPVNACEQIKNPQDAQFAATMEKMALQRSVFYDQMLSEAQKTAMPVGVQCLENAKKAQDKAIQDKQNYLTNLITQLKNQDQLLKATLEDSLKKMRSLHWKLEGGANETLAQEGLDFVKEMDKYPSCKTVLSSSILANAKSFGFNGLKKSITTNASGKSQLDMAYEAKSGKYRADLNKQIDRLKDKIQSKGFEGWKKSYNPEDYTSGGYTKFAGMDNTIISGANELYTEWKSAAEYLKKEFQYDLPPLDRNFNSKMTSFEAEAAKTFKKKAIQECVTDPSSIGYSNDEILSGVQQQGVSSSKSGTLAAFRKALRQILENDQLFISDKLDQIKALQAEGGPFYGSNIYIQVENTRGTPYQLYASVVSKCNTKYETEVASAENKTGDTFKDKVAIAQKYISDLRKMESNFINDLTKSLQDKYLNCSSSSINAVGGCSASNMDASKDGFCVKSAESCAVNIQNCMNNIDNVITATTTALGNEAINFNGVVKNYIAQRQQLLSNQAFQTMFGSDWLGQFFNNTGYKVPDLSVKLPEKKFDDNLKVDLIGGGSLGFLEDGNPANIISALKSLSGMIKEQGAKVNAEIADHINKQKAAIQKEKDFWDNLANNCKKVGLAYSDSMNKQYNDALQQQMEQQKMLYEFCSKYRMMIAAPGCDSDYSPRSLYNDSIKVASFLNPEVQANLAAYQRVCNASNSKASNELKDSKMSALGYLCQKEGSWAAIKSSLSDLATKRLGDKIKLEDIQTEDQAIYDAAVKDLPANEKNIARFLRTVLTSKVAPNSELVKNEFKRISANVDYSKDGDATALCAGAVETNKEKCQQLKMRIDNLYNKYDPTSSDLCKNLEASQYIQAIIDTGDKYSNAEVEKKFSDIKAKNEVPSEYASINLAAKNLFDLPTTASFESKLGENEEIPCQAGNSSGLNAGKSFDPANPFGEFDRGIQDMINTQRQ